MSFSIARQSTIYDIYMFLDSRFRGNDIFL